MWDLALGVVSVSSDRASDTPRLMSPSSRFSNTIGAIWNTAVRRVPRFSVQQPTGSGGP